MTKIPMYLLGPLMAGAMGAALLCGAAEAQGYDVYRDGYYDGYRDGYYQGQPPSQDYGGRDYYYQGAPPSRGYDGYRDGYYDRPPPSETVIVHPNYDRVQKKQLLGNVDGEINPVVLSISRPVSYADLDLSRESDYLGFRARIYDTARDLCRRLNNYHDVGLMNGGDESRCISDATRNAMRQVDYPGNYGLYRR